MICNKLKKVVSFYLFIVMFIIFFGSTVNGQETSTPKEDNYSALEKYIQNEMKASYIPGLSVSIIKDNDVLYSRGFGVADSKDKKVTKETSFSIGSVSKTFAAVATMQLVEKGKIDLDAPIEKYIPWVKISVPDGAPKITVKNLLSHTSGISTKLGQKTATEDESENIKGLILKQKNIKTDKPAGDTWEYSNFNYTLIGAIVEAVSRESYKDYLRRNILIPLEMSNTYLTEEEILKGNSASGFETFFGKLIVFDYPYREDCLPEGTIYSSAEDMTHYMSMLLNDGKYKEKNILSSKSIETIRTPVAYMQSFLFGLGTCISGSIYYHGGDNFNFHAFMVLDPDKKTGAIMMFNANHYFVLNVIGLYNKLFHEQANTPESNMDQAMVNTIKGNTSYYFESVNVKKLYVVFDALFLIIIVLISSSVYRLKYWKKRMAEKSKLKIIYIIWSIVVNAIIPIIIICIPKIYGTNWRSIYYNIPDLGYGLIAIALILLAIGVIKVSIALSLIKFKKLKKGSNFKIKGYND